VDASRASCQRISADAGALFSEPLAPFQPAIGSGVPDMPILEQAGIGITYKSDGGMEACMPDILISFDRHISGDCREGSTDSSVTPGIVLAALIAVLFLFGPRVFDTVKSAADMSTPQANTEAPTTGKTKTP
jgi:hypothetical protein